MLIVLKANSSSPSQEIPWNLHKCTVHYRAHKSLQLLPCARPRASKCSYHLQGPVHRRSILLDPWRMKATLSFETSGTHHPKTQRRISEVFSRERSPDLTCSLSICEFNFRFFDDIWNGSTNGPTPSQIYDDDDDDDVTSNFETLQNIPKNHELPSYDTGWGKK